MIFTKRDNALFLRDDHEIVEIRPWGTDALRVRSTLNPRFTQDDKGLLPAGGCSEIIIDEAGASIQNGRIRCTVSSLGCLRFYRDDNLVLSEYYRGREANPHSRPIKTEARQYKTLISDYEIVARFESDPKEKLFGMGQYQQPELDLKGTVLELCQRNSQITIPFCLSSCGYGFLWNHPGVGEVSFGKNYTRWHAECADELDYWVTVGDTPKDLLKNYTEVTGRSPKYPEDTLGLWQSKLRYRTQEEVLEVAREYHRRGIPLDVIVIDFFHWIHQGDWFFDPVYWPNPKAMVEELKSMGIRTLISIWPTADAESVNYNYMREHGLLIRTTQGTQQQLDWEGKNTVFLDTTNPETRDFIWQKAKENYYDLGIDMFWLDANEPEYSATDSQCYQYYAGPLVKCGNLYPKVHAQAFYDGLRSEGREDIVNLNRSGWVGSQRMGAILWSGDVESNFVSLRDQLSAGLNIGMAGIAWWSSDTGGFHHGDVTDPKFHELLIRWFQFSTFSPVLRLHGDRDPHDIPAFSKEGGGKMSTGRSNEIWSYGPEVEAILTKYLNLRLELKDYLASVMEEASANGSPVMRTMFYEFPEDAHCWELDDQYMLGSDYLVAPVLYEGMQQRQVYLPQGQWKDIHNGNIFSGGQTITVDTPLDIIPVFQIVK